MEAHRDDFDPDGAHPDGLADDKQQLQQQQDDSGRFQLHPGLWQHTHHLGPDRLGEILKQVIFAKTTVRDEAQIVATKQGRAGGVS